MVQAEPWKNSRPEKPRFSLGKLVATTNALRSIPPTEILNATARHHRGDWGVLNKADKKANDAAIDYGGRLFSSLKSKDGTRFWIITECDRSVTTVLLPEDY